jgi:hypothetical protein
MLFTCQADSGCKARRAELLCYHIIGAANAVGSTQATVISPRILARRILSAVLLLAASAYSVDYLWFRIRMTHPKPGDPLESIKSLRVLAIPQKNGKISYEIDQLKPEETITCVHSWFPHSGYSPCWYVKPRINQPIPM